MSQTHLLSDTIARIRNAQLVKKEYTIVYHSKMIASVLNVFLKEGYIGGIEVFEERKGVSKIKVRFKYSKNSNKPVISEIKTISKPGRRVFQSYRDLEKLYGGLGAVLLSTSKGVITDSEARNMKVGGEVLCSIF